MKLVERSFIKTDIHGVLRENGREELYHDRYAMSYSWKQSRAALSRQICNELFVETVERSPVTTDRQRAIRKKG